VKPAFSISRYLVRNSHGYCFRMVVPKDLRPLIGKRELRYSLKARHRNRAENIAQSIGYKIKTLFGKIRKEDPDLMELSSQEINEILRKYVMDSIRDFDERYHHHEPPFGYEGGLQHYIRDLDIVDFWFNP